MLFTITGNRSSRGEAQRRGLPRQRAVGLRGVVGTGYRARRSSEAETVLCWHVCRNVPHTRSCSRVSCLPFHTESSPQSFSGTGCCHDCARSLCGGFSAAWFMHVFILIITTHQTLQTVRKSRESVPVIGQFPSEVRMKECRERIMFVHRMIHAPHSRQSWDQKV